ncbi:4Fe-4S binding protein [Pseudodesulfovibrio sp.]|uniref:4Fe-4S binding protein n=1 Tax=unclassified Pseudodesulfovibrio TaxID=2661612 RepID=UPI003AFF9706
MRYVTSTLTILALLLAGAHSLRGGEQGLACALLLLACLVFTRRAWVRPVVAVTLIWFTWIWADSSVHFLRFRMELEQPWERLALIMGGVMAVNVSSLVFLGSESARRYFSRDTIRGTGRASVFLLTAAGLAVARAKVPFPVLLADRYFPAWGWMEVLLLALYAQWIFGVSVQPQGHRAVRPRIWGLFSLVFFGQLALGLFGMENMLMTGKLHLPVPALIAAGPVFRGGGYFMPILFGVTLLLVGPAWCSHLCYIGAWDDVMSRSRKRSHSYTRFRILSTVGRGGILIFCLGAAWLLRMHGASASTAILCAAVFGLLGVGVMVSVSRRTGIMAHCTTYCPMGVIAVVLGKLSPWRIRISDGCTQCGVCIPHCRYNALDEDRVAEGSPALSCTLCGDCVGSCPHGRIGYRFPGLHTDMARTIFLVLVISLHAIFLGVARI